MGRIVYLMMGIIAINLGLMLFSCDTWDSVTGECTAPLSPFWNAVLGPSDFTEGSTFWGLLFGTAGGLASVAAVILFIGSFFLKVEFPIYAGITIALAPMVVSWTKFWLQVSDSKFFAGHTKLGLVVGMILISPIVITYIFTLLDWARGRD